MARFFIDRPIFAWVLSILLMGVGILSILNLPVAQYPQIAPPTVSVSAAYPGASAETITNTVTQVIEQQMTGLDGLRYFSSNSTSAGTANVTLTFETGTDADIAQQLNATIAARSLLRTPEDFRQIVLRAETDGGLVLLGDVARVEIGSENYSTIARFKRAPAAGMGISLATGANALETAEAVEARMQELSAFFPAGMHYVVPYNTAPFVRISI